jgi:SSS family solute:Na+ symporter
MICAFVVSVALQVFGGYDSDKPADFAWVMLITVGVTTAVWLAVTYLTSPEPTEKLVAFYRKTRPSRRGWGPIAAAAPDVRPSGDAAANLVDWISGCVLIYAVLFGVGKLILKEFLPGFGLLGLGALAGWIIYRDLSRRGWGTVAE